MVRMEVDLRGRRQERVHTRPNLRRMGTFKRANDGRDLLHTQTHYTAGSNSESKPRPRTSRPHIPSTSHAPETACSNSRRRGLLIFRPWDRKPGTAKARGRERMTQELDDALIARMTSCTETASHLAPGSQGDGQLTWRGQPRVPLASCVELEFTRSVAATV